jgi:hypothetical protein
MFWTLFGIPTTIFMIYFTQIWMENKRLAKYGHIYWNAGIPIHHWTVGWFQPKLVVMEHSWIQKLSKMDLERLQVMHWY